ncbi:MAG: 50S ribosomal protein L29 [Vulcanimicrobiota bacterium]
MAGLKKHKDNLRGKSLDELRQALVDSQDELFTLRFQLATKNLDNHRGIRKTKKEIARIHTIIREKELTAAQEGSK